MKFSVKLLKTSCALSVASILMVACGGGNQNSTNVGTTQPIVLAEKDTIYQGTISGLGSIIVNGVRFSTIDSMIKDDDDVILSPSDLSIGSTVHIRGLSDDSTALGSANEIMLDHGVQGKITAINLTSSVSELTVLGQRIVINTQTAYKNIVNVSALIAGDVVEVYGLRQTDGSFLATLIEKKPNNTSLKPVVILPGVISNLNTSNKTFVINKVTVNYTTANVKGVLINGAEVKVKASAEPVANVLTANKVVVRKRSDEFKTATATTIIKFKGVVSTAPVNGLITIANTPIDLSKATFKGGSLNDVKAGSIIEVKGTWNGTTLIANGVEFEGAREAKLGATVQVFGVVGTLTSSKMFVVNGITVDASNATFEGGAINNIATGVYIEIKGNIVGDVLKAKVIEFKKSNNPTGGYYEMGGSVSDFVSLSQFVVNGITVDASHATNLHPERRVVNGKSVYLKGKQNDKGVFVATKIAVKE